MIEQIQENLAVIADICSRHRVARLEVFGSAVGADFDAQSSDLDFLVDFEADADLGPWLSTYFDLKRELEELLARSVDLVMPGAMRNPYFIREVNRTRQLIYAR